MATADQPGFRRGLPAIVLFAVLLSATVHNYVGVLVALTLVFWLRPFLSGRIYFGGFAGAFYIASLYALLRMIFPAAVTLDVQLQESVRFLAIAIFATAVWRMAPVPLLRALTWFFVVMLLLLPVYLTTGAFSVVDASGALRFSALMPHANHLGYVAASSALTLLYIKIKKLTGNWSHVLIAVLIVIVVSTRSSGALMVLVIGFAALVFILRPTFQRAAMILAGLLLMAGLLQTPPGQLALEKITAVDVDTAIDKATRYQFGDQGSSLAWRVSYWTAMINAQFDAGPRAVWFGHGGGAATQGDQLYFFMAKDPHSDFVKLFLDYGVLGTILIVTALARATWATGARLVGLVVFFGPMLTGNSLTSSPVIFILLCNAALLHAASKRAS